MSDAKLRVGFIGLGIMGQAMAANLLKDGFELTVYNRSGAKAQPLVAAGAQSAATPAQVAAASDVIFSCVTADNDVLEVLLGESADPAAAIAPGQSVLGGVRSGAVVVDCSTVSPATAHRCAAALATKGCGFLDAPVSGGDVGARAGR